MPGAACQAASPPRALRDMMTGTKIFSGGKAIGRRLPRPAHRLSRPPAVLGSFRRSPTLSSPVRPLTPLPRSPGADFPDWWTQVRTHVTRSCVCVCRLSQTAALVFASLDCLQIFPYHKTQSLLGSKKSHSCLSGGDTTAGT